VEGRRKRTHIPQNKESEREYEGSEREEEKLDS